MTRYTTLFGGALAIFAVIRGLLLFDGSDEALYLTEYIESGDIEAVILSIDYSNRACCIVLRLEIWRQFLNTIFRSKITPAISR